MQISLLHLDAGSKWVKYYDAIQKADMDHNGRTKERNFALQGAYVGITWTVDVA